MLASKAVREFCATMSSRLQNCTYICESTCKSKYSKRKHGFNFLIGVLVSMGAFHALEPGSIPGSGMFFLFWFDACQVIDMRISREGASDLRGR